MDTINNQFPIHTIDSPCELETFCGRIETSSWLAIDTEFLRENTYFPKFCLLQVANAEQVACIDPLAIEDLGPLFDILYKPGIVKIFHSARQDMEIFYNIRAKLPSPVFDTQLAAPLLGLADQISYATLVSEMLGIELIKGHTRTDWSNRPLSPAQINYAGNDVFYLARVYLKMYEQLSNLGRLDWLSDDFAALLDPENYQNPPDKAWQRIRGAHNLNGGSLTVLQSLANWRERTAYCHNVPRNWIVKDDALLRIARLQPIQTDELRTLRGLHERAFERYGKEICALVEKTRDNPPITSDFKFRTVQKSPQQEVLINLLSGVVHQIALEHSLSATILAPKKDLDLLISGDPDSKLLRGWRKAIVGEQLLAILRGDAIIAINNGVIHLESRSLGGKHSG
ncbi:MAG: ribonuclease D [Methylococcaceae bacterium]|nr:ribonuclease D [Methylococcaceae bacterium]